MHGRALGCCLLQLLLQPLWLQNAAAQICPTVTPTNQAAPPAFICNTTTYLVPNATTCRLVVVQTIAYPYSSPGNYSRVLRWAPTRGPSSPVNASNVTADRLVLSRLTLVGAGTPAFYLDPTVEGVNLTYQLPISTVPLVVEVEYSLQGALAGCSSNATGRQTLQLGWAMDLAPEVLNGYSGHAYLDGDLRLGDESVSALTKHEIVASLVDPTVRAVRTPRGLAWFKTTPVPAQASERFFVSYSFTPPSPSPSGSVPSQVAPEPPMPPAFAPSFAPGDSTEGATFAGHQLLMVILLSAGAYCGAVMCATLAVRGISASDASRDVKIQAAAGVPLTVGSRHAAQFPTPYAPSRTFAASPAPNPVVGEQITGWAGASPQPSAAGGRQSAGLAPSVDTAQLVAQVRSMGRATGGGDRPPSLSSSLAPGSPPTPAPPTHAHTTAPQPQ